MAVLVPRVVDHWQGVEWWMGAGAVLSVLALVSSLRDAVGRAPARPRESVVLLVLQVLFWGVGALYGVR